MINTAISFALLAFVTQAQAQVATQSVIELRTSEGLGFSFGIDEISDVKVNDNINLNQITFSVNAHTSEKLTNLTAKNIGKQVSILLCGEEISNPTIHSPIFGGGLALAGFKKGRAEEIGDVLSGRRSCSQ